MKIFHNKTFMFFSCITLIIIFFALGIYIGFLNCNKEINSIRDETFQQLRGNGNVPAASEDFAKSELTDLNFQPSDQPPKCLPNGTVTYEVFDSAANRRYWVFRWPEDKGYSIIPRDMVTQDGQIVPYQPGYSVKNIENNTVEEQQ